MKKFLLIFGLMIMLSVAANAQAQLPKAVWVTIKVDKFKCPTCTELLDQYLIRENRSSMNAGMLKWQIKFNAGFIRVQYLNDRTNEKAIRVAINNAGFDADTEKATEDSYKMLPKNCKRKEDGGIILPTKEQCP